MKIVALDPGTRQTGTVIYDTDPECHLVSLAKLENAEVGKFLAYAATAYGVKVFAIEKMQSYGMPVGTEVFETCEWIGRFIEKAIALRMVIWPVYRKPVVTWLTGSAKGNDSAVCKTLVARFGAKEVGRIGSDLRSAIAVAMFVAAKIESGAPPPSVLGILG